MNKSEFEKRVSMSVSVEEYASIEEVYMNSDLDKDDFCKMWVKMNQSRVNKAKAAAKAQAKEDAKREALWNIINRNHYNAYNQFAEDYFSQAQQRRLAEVGIQMSVERVEPIWGHTVRDPKLVSTVIYEIKKYLKAA